MNVFGSQLARATTFGLVVGTAFVNEGCAELLNLDAYAEGDPIADGGMGGQGGSGGAGGIAGMGGAVTTGGMGGAGGMMAMDPPPTFSFPQRTNLANNRIYVRLNPPTQVPDGLSTVGYGIAWTGAATGTKDISFQHTAFDARVPGSYEISAWARYNNGTQSQSSDLLTVTVDNSMQARYTFDEGTGMMVADSIGPPFEDGTAANIGPASWVPGIADDALNHDGIDDYVGLGDVFNFERTNPFSFEAWTNRAALGAGHMIFGRMDFSDTAISRGYWLGYESDDRLYFLLRHDNSLIDLLRVRTSTAFPVANTPQHVTFTYDGTSAAAGVQIFVDGAAQMTDLLDDTLSDTTLNGAPARIGAAIANGGDASSFKNVFEGIIDDAAIYNRVLTTAETINNMCAREALNREENNDPSPLPAACN